jgi:predicted small lipoprotein YifL
MHCWARTAFYIVVAMLGIASMIGACGQKGPLSLPEQPVAASSAPETDVAADVPTAAIPGAEPTAPADTPLPTP